MAREMNLAESKSLRLMLWKNHGLSQRVTDFLKESQDFWYSHFSHSTQVRPQKQLWLRLLLISMLFYSRYTEWFQVYILHLVSLCKSLLFQFPREEWWGHVHKEMPSARFLLASNNWVLNSKTIEKVKFGLINLRTLNIHVPPRKNGDQMLLVKKCRKTWRFRWKSRISSIVEWLSDFDILYKPGFWE